MCCRHAMHNVSLKSCPLRGYKEVLTCLTAEKKYSKTDKTSLTNFNATLLGTHLKIIALRDIDFETSAGVSRLSQDLFTKIGPKLAQN